MNTFLTVLHVIVCIFLILVVLLQAGRAAAWASHSAAGGSQTVFGSSGAGNFLTRLTSITAVIFIVTSMVLGPQVEPAGFEAAAEARRARRPRRRRPRTARLDKLKAEHREGGRGQGRAVRRRRRRGAPADDAGDAALKHPPLKLTAAEGRPIERSGKPVAKSAPSPRPAKPAKDGPRPSRRRSRRSAARRRPRPREPAAGTRRPRRAAARRRPSSRLGDAMALPFTKVEGLGNDFLVVDLRPGEPARALAARRRGSGDRARPVRPPLRRGRRRRAGDPARSKPATRACACSTPTAARPRCAATASAASPSCCTTRTQRCAAPPCASRPAPACSSASWTSRTDACRTVAVEMGRPALDARRDPDAARRRGPRAARADLRRGGRTFQLTAVSMGNPHAVIFVDDATSLRALAEDLGPAVRDRPRASRSGPTSSSRACAPSGENRSGRLGARQRHHARLRHRRLRDGGRGLPGRAAVRRASRRPCIFRAARSSSPSRRTTAVPMRGRPEPRGVDRRRAVTGNSSLRTAASLSDRHSPLARRGTLRTACPAAAGVARGRRAGRGARRRGV